MALTNLFDRQETEEFKFHILLDHLKVDEARCLALACSYDPQPFTEVLRALEEHYGQPRQLAVRDTLDTFALRVPALVGLLRIMDDQGNAELLCDSHVDTVDMRETPG